MKIDARSVVRFAKKNGRPLRPGHMSYCAVATIGDMLYPDNPNDGYRKMAFGYDTPMIRDMEKWKSIEAGFEQEPNFYPHKYKTPRGNRYYKMGENIRKLAEQANILETEW